MGGGCAVSTIVCDVRTWWVRDVGRRLAGCTQTRVNVHGCMQRHVGGKALARSAWGWLRGCWGVQWLCRWVLDVTRSPGKIRGSGGVGMGYDTADWHLLGIDWGSRFYYLLMLVFRLKSAPCIFNLFAEALHWIIQ